MKPRPYNSAARTQAAEATRARIVAAATKMLLSKKGFRSFSLEAVARSARVTRLTVYNQFGSRRALLEAVFDDRASKGGLFRVGDAVSDPDPKDGLRRLIAIFCEFWTFNESAIQHMQSAGASNPQFAASIRARNERRRKAIAALIARIVPQANAGGAGRTAIVDTLFALTSHAFFQELRSGGQTAGNACAIIERLAFDALEKIGAARLVTG